MTSFIGPTKVFAHLDRLAAWQTGRKPAPVTVEWDLSNRCYLGCDSCHFAHTHTRGPWATKDRRLPMAWEGTGDLADTAMVLRGLSEMASAGVRGVVWSGGGEPTTHPDLAQIVAHASSSGLEQGMYTAGGLLTPSRAALLAQTLTWVVVSLDTITGEDYARTKHVHEKHFEAAKTGIRGLVGGKATVGVSFLLHSENWTQAERMVELGRSLGATYVTLRPRIDTEADHQSVCTADRSWITQALPSLDQLSRERDVEVSPDRFAAYRDWTGHGYAVCHGIKMNATITPDGRVWVCLQRRGMQGSCVGDLRTQSFEDLWETHPGVWTDFAECRVMCRLHLVNQVLDAVYSPREHAAFV